MDRSLLDAASSVLEALRAVSWAREEFEPDVDEIDQPPAMPDGLDDDLGTAETALTNALVNLTASIAGPQLTSDEEVPPPAR